MKSVLRSPCFALCLLICGYLLLESLLPLRTAVQIGGDEGFELAKATLCLKGYKLYEQVWNDQPPLHTFLVAKIVQLGGMRKERKSESQNPKTQNPNLKKIPNEQISNAASNLASPLGPRVVSVFFGAVMIASLYWMARRVNGLAVAVVACFMLICSPGFLGLSGSVMLEVPSIATALAATAILVGTLNHKLPGSQGSEEGKKQSNREAHQRGSGGSNTEDQGKAADSVSFPFPVFGEGMLFAWRS